MSTKQVAATVGGFTMLPDILIKKYSRETALVFGIIWRHCQMERKVCDASQKTLCEMAGISKDTFIRHATILVNDGYFDKVVEPGIGSTYKDTGKLSMNISVGVNELPVAESDTYQSQRATPTSRRERHLPVAESDTKKQYNKTIKETKILKDNNSEIEFSKQYRDEIANKIFTMFKMPEAGEKGLYDLNLNSYVFEIALEKIKLHGEEKYFKVLYNYLNKSMAPALAIGKANIWVDNWKEFEAEKPQKSIYTLDIS